MTDTKDALYPKQWNTLGTDFNPKDVMIKLERFDKKTNKKIESDYLGVPGRLMWFITDQRCMIVNGIANTSYEIRTEMVVCDVVAGYAQFKTYIRDVLGNEATMYGSETKLDFGDYSEKASTKSVGRALLMLGYGTNAANELDEGERIVDAPVVSHKAKTTNDTAQNNKAVSTSNNTVVNTNTGGDTAKVKEELKSLMGLFGLTVDEIKAYLDKYKMPFDAKASADIVNALQHPQNSFKVVSRIKGIPQELFDAWATKEGNSWVSMYATATKDCQAFYTAISPKSSANIATGSI